MKKRMNLAERYEGKNVVLLIVPEHSTTKKGWLVRFKNEYPEFSKDFYFRVVTPKAKLAERIRKINSYYNNIFFVNNPLENVELTYTELLRGLRNSTVVVNGGHLFRHREKLHIYSTELNSWDSKVANYLS